MRTRRGRWIWALLALAAGLAGCGPKGPQTYPVQGRVEVQGGDLKPLVGGTVEFLSEADPNIHGYGEIKDDGTFTMTTLTQGVGQEGVVEGSHKVRIMLNVEDNDDRGARLPPSINPRYTRFETSGITWKVPSEDKLVIKVSP